MLLVSNYRFRCFFLVSLDFRVTQGLNTANRPIPGGSEAGLYSSRREGLYSSLCISANKVNLVHKRKVIQALEQGQQPSISRFECVIGPIIEWL